MSSNELVLRVVQALERLQVPYMIVGSFSSNAYGIARSTQDADFVIELADPSALFQALAPELQFDPQMVLETVTMTTRYVGRHRASGFKVELFLVSEDPHDRERFRRRRLSPFLGATAFLPAPEDVLIQKLKWFGRARRAKDWEDAGNVLTVQQANLDLGYVRHWCDHLGTRELFEKLLSETPQA